MKRRRDVVSQKSLETALFSFAILLRALVGFHPHSDESLPDRFGTAIGIMWGWLPALL